ncbi:MAG: ABC transporter ATP-binding protein [Anaerolineae bacterium]|nr:ABC transporter ATP-binding protein [Anaerolineae bacterium]
MEHIIETQSLTKVYGDGAQVRALDDVSIQIAKGEFVAVMGPSGSGKSTLLNMLGALDLPSSGKVLINGQDLQTVKNLDAFRAQTVGFVFQLHNLIPTLNALENVEVPMMGQPVGRGERRKRAEELLSMVGLGDRMHHLPNQLSGGQRQRVAIARSLANKPSLVLADEPTGNLDSQSGSEVINLLRELNRDLKTTFVVVTHDLAVARQTDRVLVMHDGKIADDHRVGNPFEEDLKTFLGSGLGQAIFSGDPNALEVLRPQQRVALQNLLANRSS